MSLTLGSQSSNSNITQQMTEILETRILPAVERKELEEQAQRARRTESLQMSLQGALLEAAAMDIDRCKDQASLARLAKNFRRTMGYALKDEPQLAEKLVEKQRQLKIQQ